MTSSMATAPHLDITVDKMEDGAEEIIKRIKPAWDLQALKFQHFTEGLCNRIVGVYQADNKDDMVLVRVFGEKTELLVDREAEKETFIFLSQVGYSKPLYCTFNNGMAYSFVKGRTLDGEMVRDKNIRTLIAKELAKIHSLKKEDDVNPKPRIISRIQKFLDSVPESFEDDEKQRLFTRELKSKAVLQQEFDMLKKHIEALTCDVVFCHNDLLLKNIVFDSQSNKVGFIDYEFAFYNFQAFDIATHFVEYAGMSTEMDFTQYPDRDYQLSWIRIYLEEYYILNGQQKTPTDRDVEKLYVQANKCSLASHFFCGLSGLVMTKYSKIDFGYLEFAVARFKEYFRRRDEFLSMKEPKEKTLSLLL